MNKQEIEKAINGLEQLKPLLQTLLIQVNNDSLGKEDAREIGEHFDIALWCMEQQLNGGWIPISLRKPTMEECQENDCRFIVTDTNRTYQSLFDYKNKYFIAPRFDCSGWTEDACVIYWQPMPDRPKLNKEDKDAERNFISR